MGTKSYYKLSDSSSALQRKWMRKSHIGKKKSESPMNCKTLHYYSFPIEFIPCVTLTRELKNANIFFCTLNLQTSSIWVASSIHTKYTAIVTKLDKITSSDRYESAFVFDGKCKLFCHLSYNNFLLSSFVYNDSFNAYAFASIMRRHSHFVRRKFVIYLLRHTHTNTNICADFT